MNHPCEIVRVFIEVVTLCKVSARACQICDSLRRVTLDRLLAVIIHHLSKVLLDMERLNVFVLKVIIAILIQFLPQIDTCLTIMPTVVDHVFDLEHIGVVSALACIDHLEGSRKNLIDDYFAYFTETCALL